MFVIRGTQKLLKEWETEPLQVDIYPPLNSWHASLFLLNRRKNIVFMHDISRLSVTLFGIKKSQYKNLPSLFVQTLMESIFIMKAQDLEPGCELEKNQWNNRIVFKTDQYKYPIDVFKELLEKHYKVESS